MAIKYTKPDPTDDAPSGRTRVTGSQARFRRYSTSPPSRKALTWIIMGTAMIVTLLTITSELPFLDVKNTTVEYVWKHGTVISNESSNGQRVLRVEISAEGDEPPHVYDISLDGHGDWAALASEDSVRIQAQLDAAGNIKRIIKVEPVDGPAADEESPENEGVAE